MAVTLKQIADAAGVSRGTVDRVINKRGHVRPEVEKRILQIAKDLHYRPNPYGRALVKSTKTSKIGVICQFGETPFMKLVVEGIEQARKEITARGSEIIIKTILEGKYNAKPVKKDDQATNYWWGMQSGVIDIHLGKSLSPYTKKLVEMFRSDLVDGSASPFDGQLKSQNGFVRKKKDPPLTSMDIIKMDWLNDNIVGEIPDKETLTDEAKSTVSVSGVKA